MRLRTLQRIGMLLSVSAIQESFDVVRHGIDPASGVDLHHPGQLPVAMALRSWLIAGITSSK